MKNQKIVLITGVSSGLGRAFAIQSLNAGYRVVGTLRRAELVPEFEAQKPGQAFARVLDVKNHDQITQVVEDVEKNIGAVDVLINNAGYGHEGILEESSMEELRDQFEVNVLGAVAMIKAVLPFMRKRRKGHIINVTSMGGLMTMPGISFYCGSKFALEGISSSLGKELKSFGIFVTALEPGQFRTDWAGRSMIRSPRSISDYDKVFEPIRAARVAKSGKQPGDPAKAGRAVITLIESPAPPAHLLLGPDAFEFVDKDLHALRSEFAQWETVTRSTNFDQ
ncbi:MAG: oxidoreductase [Verrucomicrobia bacterium]|nr:oxidoreductase [Verrucomicrobiota bacterium]